MAVSLLLVALLLVFSLNVFGSGDGKRERTGGGGGSAAPSILSHSSAETQIKLCSEGRDSTYGSPPSAAQQAACIRELLTGSPVWIGPVMSRIETGDAEREQLVRDGLPL